MQHDDGMKTPLRQDSQKGHSIAPPGSGQIEGDRLE
jgi:hypothetical protein